MGGCVLLLGLQPFYLASFLCTTGFFPHTEMEKKIHFHLYSFGTLHFPYRPELQSHQTQRTAATAQSWARLMRAGSLGGQARRHTIQGRTIQFSLFPCRQCHGDGLICHLLPFGETQVGYRRHAVMGAVVKLQQDLLRGTLPKRSGGRLDTWFLLGSCAVESRRLVSKFTIHDSWFMILQFMILHTVLSIKKKISYFCATFFFFFRHHIMIVFFW